MNSGLLAGVGGQLRVPAECSDPPLQGSANIPCHPCETAALTSGSSFPSVRTQRSVIAESAGHLTVNSLCTFLPEHPGRTVFTQVWAAGPSSPRPKSWARLMPLGLLRTAFLETNAKWTFSPHESELHDSRGLKLAGHQGGAVFSRGKGRSVAPF